MHEHDAEISRGFWAKNLLASGGTRPRIPRQPEPWPLPPSSWPNSSLCPTMHSSKVTGGSHFPMEKWTCSPASTFPGGDGWEHIRWKCLLPTDLGPHVIDPQGKASLPPRRGESTRHRWPRSKAETRAAALAHKHRPWASETRPPCCGSPTSGRTSASQALPWGWILPDLRWQRLHLRRQRPLTGDFSKPCEP